MSIHELLEQRDIHLWHFTDQSNVALIKSQNAILCSKELARLGIAHRTGGNDHSNEADKYFGMDNYVHLCFSKNHPLEWLAKRDGRITTTCWIEIHRKILLDTDARFTKGVSNKSGEQLLGSEEAAVIIDLPGILDWLDFNIPENKTRRNDAKKAEILIPKCVDGSYIIGYHG